MNLTTAVRGGSYIFLITDFGQVRNTVPTGAIDPKQAFMLGASKIALHQNGTQQLISLPPTAVFLDVSYLRVLNTTLPAAVIYHPTDNDAKTHYLSLYNCPML